MSDFKMIINGQLVDGEASSFDVVNPATEKPFAQCPAASHEQLDQAVAAAKAAQPAWAATPIEERGAMLDKIADLLVEHKAEIGEILAQENGKPLPNAIGEIGGAAVAWTRNTAKLRLPEETLKDDDDALIKVHYKPLGVVASITPWNHPILILIWHLMPGLLAGNTMVSKPSSMTPLSTLKVIELMNSVLPAGVINCVTGEGGLGRKITSHDDIAKIVFTGSTPTGINIMQAAAPTMKRLTLELGGNDAAIVLDDADLEKCADNIFARIFGNSGQTCAALKRLYVHESKHDQLVEMLVERVKKASVGAWNEEGVKFGPVQNKDQFDFVMELIEDTKAKGGNFVVGGKAMDRDGYFIELSIATDVTDGMRIVDEEPFGPIVPVIKFSDTEDALRRANDNENGLGGSIWTADEEKGWELAKRLESGTGWVNQHSQQMPFTPFGGAKMSGVGVEHGLHGLVEYTQLQTLHMNRKGGAM